MKKLLLIILVFFIHVTAMAQSGFSTIEERMTGVEFKETGLGKLTDQELANLNDWLRSHSVATLENASARSSARSSVGAASAGAASASATSAGVTQDTRGLETKKKDDTDGLGKVINSAIVGTFDGWNRKGTLFKLANGMIWQQAEKDTFYIKAVEDPEVTITKGFMGSWHLSLVGHNSKVKVKRIQ